MSRFFVFYLVACIILFASLTGLFSAMKLNQMFTEQEPPTEQFNGTEIDERPPPFTKEEFIRAAREDTGLDVKLDLGMDHPLLLDAQYKVGNPVMIFESGNFDSAKVEVLPEGGVFHLISTSGSNNQGWTHRIRVSDGVRNYVMYMRHEDLESWEYFGDWPPPEERQLHAQRLAKREQDKRDEEAEVEARYQAALQRYREAEALRQSRNPFRNAIVGLQENIARFDSNGFWFNALVAALVTFLVAFFVGTIGVLRNTRAWESDFGFDDINPSRPFDDTDDVDRDQDEYGEDKADSDEYSAYQNDRF